ncbi:sulfatase family protein [Polaribacter sp.]|uniref:sulfatase family protein n=1 Tax=Polaribacter sp. TaxID=1920175 RepID=UPI003F69E3A5
MKINVYILFILICFITRNKGIAQNSKPNILLITLDDMNWNSPSVYGGILPDLTPNIDAIAKSGVLFENAYVQAPNCSPSRVVIQTGLYPHQSGMRGFYYVKDNINTLPEILKANGYFTGVINKTADTSLNPDFKKYWDSYTSLSGAKKRSAKMYGELLEKFLKKGDESSKPFYCVVNIADPHKPFFNDPEAKKKGFDKFPPSKIYSLKDVEIPSFLPKNDKIKQEVLNYYNSVKRGDDCVGDIMKILQTSKFAENTIVILLSDHGMPFPFAKSSIYQNGIKTPLLVSWPSKYKPNIDKKSMISAIDIAPTILDMANLSIPKKMEGKSILPVLVEKEQQIGQYVFAQFDENAGGVPRPSRTVISKKYGYVFNPWATGKFKFKSASMYHDSYKAMRKMSLDNTKVKKRFDYWNYRTVEELYDYEKDPNAMNNLINNPNYKKVLTELRLELLNQMKRTNDYVLTSFEKRNDINFLNKWMDIELENAKKRRETIQWKRGKNQSGSTKTHTQLFDNSNQK